MAEPASYDEIVKQTYLSCLRSVLIIDDDYPTLDGLLNRDLSPSSKYEYKVPASQVLEIVKGLRTPSDLPPLLVDIHDGTNISLGTEKKIAEHLHQSDFVILDYFLENHDPSKSLAILSKLAENNHFNLVLIHSSEEPTDIFPKVALRLLSRDLEIEIPSEEIDNAEEALAAIDEAHYDALFKVLFPDPLAYLAFRQDKRTLKSKVLRSKNKLKNFDDFLEDKGLEKRFEPGLLASLICTFHNENAENMVGGAEIGDVSFDLASETKWIKADTLFVGFTQKSDEKTDLVAEMLKALLAWKPQPPRLIMRQLVTQLDEFGSKAENHALRSRHASALWYKSLLQSPEIARRALIGETINRHSESLLSYIHPELNKMTENLLKGENTADPNEVCKKHFKVDLTKSSDESTAIGQHNLLVSNTPEIGTQLYTGQVFRIGQDYWLCLSAACDLVPEQQKAPRKAIFGEEAIPFVAVKLRPTNKKTAERSASDKRFIYLMVSDEMKYFCVNVPQSEDSYWDWHTFIATHSGEIPRDTKTLKIARIETDQNELKIKHYDAEVVGQLRYTYASALAAEFSSKLTRIGLDYAQVSVKKTK